MASVAQLVRASGCGSEGRGFEPHRSPHKSPLGIYVDTSKASIVQLFPNLSNDYLTITVTGFETAVVPVVSRTVAVSVCEPLATLLVFQE
jgi:hypothetical protein